MAKVFVRLDSLHAPTHARPRLLVNPDPNPVPPSTAPSELHDTVAVG